MEKYIRLLKNCFILSALLSMVFIVGGKFNIVNINAHVPLFSAVVSIGILSFYLVIILSDIQKNRFLILGILNYVALAGAFLVVLDVAIIRTPWVIFYAIYLMLFIFFNLTVMNFIYNYRKTMDPSFLKQWFWFFGFLLGTILLFYMLKKFVWADVY